MSYHGKFSLCHIDRTSTEVEECVFEVDVKSPHWTESKDDKGITALSSYKFKDGMQITNRSSVHLEPAALPVCNADSASSYIFS